MASNIIGIPLAFLAIKVIKDYSGIEVLLREIKSEVLPVPPEAEHLST